MTSTPDSTPLSPLAPSRYRLDVLPFRAALWLGAALLLLAGIGVGAVDRSQEARVLETAREMTEGPPRQWLVPRLNGRVRLQKPPLAYWMSAVSFELFGVGETQGRAPFAVVGLITVAVTFAAARWLFGIRAAFFAAAALLGSELFFRHSQLAETDGPVTLFVTAAAYAMWRGYAALRRYSLSPVLGGEGRGEGRASAAEMDAPHPDPLPSTQGKGGKSGALWFNLAAVAVALAALTKGPPAAYPLLFFVALACLDRRWVAFGRWALSGAPLVLALVALPWFVYAAFQPEFRQAVGDLRNSAAGGQGHNEWFFVYFPQLVAVVAPWTGFVVAAIADAVGRFRHDWRNRGLLVWSGSILVPLCLWGNKQIHYLMPLMPPLLILAGAWIDRAISSPREAPVAKAGRAVLVVTLVVCALAAPAAVAMGHRHRGHVNAADVALGVAGIAVGIVGLALYRRRGLEPAAVAAAAGSPLVLALAIAWWFPSLEPATPRTVAATLRSEFGGRPFAFYSGETLPLVFNLRTIVPVIGDRAGLHAEVARRPDLVVLVPRGRRLDNPAAAGLVEHRAFRIGENTLRVYTSAPTAR